MALTVDWQPFYVGEVCMLSRLLCPGGANYSPYTSALQASSVPPSRSRRVFLSVVQGCVGSGLEIGFKDDLK